MLEIGGFRLLTDPTFDPAGSEFTSGPVTLRKTVGPALGTADEAAGIGGRLRPLEPGKAAELVEPLPLHHGDR